MKDTRGMRGEADMTSQGRAKARRIASAIKILEKQKSGTLTRELAGLLFFRANPDDVAAFSQETLADLVRSAADALAQHRPGKAIARVSDLSGRKGAPAGLTIVEVVSDNMPFLVDSTLAELHHANADIQLVAHPVLPVERDSAGRPARILPLGADTPKNRRATSLIQITVGELSADARSELHGRLT